MDNNYDYNTGFKNQDNNTPQYNNPYSYDSQTSSQQYSQPSNASYSNPYASSNYTPNDFSSSNNTKKKKNGKGKKVGLSVAAICAALIISGGSFYAGVSYFDHSTTGSSETSASASSGTGNNNSNAVVANANTVALSDDSSEVSNTITKVVENAMPSMVSISTVSEEEVSEMYSYFYRFFDEDFDNTYEVQASGSGFIISQNSDELLIATNNHVVEGANEITVEFIDGESYTATIKGTSPDNDLAVISVKLSDISSDTLSQIKVATLGDSTKLKLGESAIAIGNALGYGQSVTVGYISATERTVQLSDKTMTLLQTDAAINPGNSGGALLNIKGEVIGINSAKYSDTSVEGTGYAIPISDALPIITDLMNSTYVPDEDKPYLGITGDSVPASYQERFDWPEGVYVSQIPKGSPAELAGLQPGDIITAIDGTAVTSMTEIQDILSEHSVGDQIKLSVTRSARGKTEQGELTATLIARKDAEK